MRMRNVAAVVGYNALTAANRNLSQSVRSLSTGLRIDGAADDAAGLAVSEKMRAQIDGLAQASENAQDGMSMIRVAEGALGETQAMLQRMRELSVQAANDTLTAEDRSFIQAEVEELVGEIDRIAATTQFNRKRLLDGSASALWSADRLSTRVAVRGDRAPARGNYRVEVLAAPGVAQVQKSNLFETERLVPRYVPDGSFSGWGYSTASVSYASHTQRYLNEGATTTGPGSGGCNHITIGGIRGGMAPGNYRITFPNQLTEAEARVASTYGMSASDIVIEPSFPPGTLNANILFEAVQTHPQEEAVTFRVLSRRFDSLGVLQPDIETFITISQQGVVGGDVDLGLITQNENGTYTTAPFTELGIYLDPTDLRLNKPPGQFAVGAKFLLNVVAPDNLAPGHAGIPIDIEAPGGGQTLRYNMSSTLPDTTTNTPIPYVYLDGATGDVAVGEILANFSGLGKQTFPHPPHWNFAVNNDGQPRTETGIHGTVEIMSRIDGTVPTRRIDVWEEQAIGDPARGLGLRGTQTLTIRQGDGKSATVTLYGSDTFAELAKKLNDAIAYGLGQAAFLDDGDADRFATVADGTPATSESARRRDERSVKSTLLIRSCVPGAAGELRFSGSEELLRALGLSTIQEARESEYRAAVYDAHTGKTVDAARTIGGNTLHGAIDGSVDITFDALTNMRVLWNEAEKRFVHAAASEAYSTVVHIAGNPTVLQVGANEGEDMRVAIGDMSAFALGIETLLLTDRTSAARAITKVDTAIGIVSAQRARLGAYENRLEHTTRNLATGHANTTAAESRIRDADMARETLAFTKWNILAQAGSSILAQANQLPQNVLALITGH